MGSDQSSHESASSKGRSTWKVKKFSQSVDKGGQSSASTTSNFARNSPRPSICSDSDIPYASYVRTPSISNDSSDKKLRWSADLKGKRRENKGTSREKRDAKSKSVGSLIVVNSGIEEKTVDNDPLLQRLLEIPPFVPIIRASLKIPWAKDTEGISERIDSTSFIRISLFYEERIGKYANLIEKQQLKLTQEISEADALMESILLKENEKQKGFGKLSEKLSRIPDLTNSLIKCHSNLNQTLELMEVLNNLLPLNDRIEPSFIWTTG